MTHYIFIDDSGSTGNVNSKYWQFVKQEFHYLSDLKDMSRQYVLYSWSDTLRPKKNLHDVMSCFEHQGTDIALIADQLNRLKISPGDYVVIITDGEVSAENVKKAENMLKNFKGCAKVYAWILEGFTGYGKSSVNVSVVLPFTRTSPYAIYGFENRLVTSTSSQKMTVDERGYTANPQKFLDEFISFRDDFLMANMGTNDLPAIRDSLADMKQKILKGIAKANTSPTETLYEDWCKAPTHEEKLAVCRAFVQAKDNRGYGVTASSDNISHLPLYQQIDLRFAQLLAYCDTHIRSMTLPSGAPVMINNTAQRAPELKEEPTVEEIEELCIDESVKWECPITFSKEYTCFLVNRPAKPLFDLNDPDDAQKANKIAAFPLLCDRFTPENIKKMIDVYHPVGVEAAKHAVDDGRNPFTREEIIGAIVLYTGSNNEHAEAVHKLNDVMMARMLFGRKLPGSRDLWIIAFLDAVQNLQPEEIIFDAPIGSLTHQYFQHRLKNHKARMTLTGLAMEPMCNVPLELAIWYCYFCEDLKIWNGRFENRFRAIAKDDVEYKDGKSKFRAISIMHYLCKFLIEPHNEIKLSDASSIFLSHLTVWKLLQEKESKIDAILDIMVEHRLVDKIDGIYYEVNRKVDIFNHMPTEPGYLKMIETGRLVVITEELEKFAMLIRNFNPNMKVIQKESHRADDDVPELTQCSYFGYDEVDKIPLLKDCPDVWISPKTYRPFHYPEWGFKAREKNGCRVTEQLSVCKYLIDFLCENEMNFASLVLDSSTLRQDFLNFMQKSIRKKQNYFLPQKVLVDDGVDFYIDAYQKVIPKNETYENFCSIVRSSQCVENRIKMQST